MCAIAGRLGEATNRNLFFLSIMTATLLPVTLITGIFGMNVGGLPWLNDPGGFAWVTGIMISAVIAVLLLLRRRRIF
jgi:zinc transporter